jgi:hypothetical protein
VIELRRAGVHGVLQPEFEVGVEMVRQALLQYTPDDAGASTPISEMQAESYERPPLP